MGINKIYPSTIIFFKKRVQVMTQYVWVDATMRKGETVIKHGLPSMLPKYLKFRTVEKVILLVICNLIYVDLFIRIASH